MEKEKLQEGQKYLVEGLAENDWDVVEAKVIKFSPSRKFVNLEVIDYTSPVWIATNEVEIVERLIGG